MSEYSWSVDRERFHGPHDSVEAAAIEAVIERGLIPGEHVWVGANTTFDAASIVRDCITAERVIEMLQEHAYDNIGDGAEDWPDISQEAHDAMDEALVAAIAPFLDTPLFWLVENPEQVEITQELYDEAHPPPPALSPADREVGR